MSDTILKYVSQLSGELEDDAYKASDALGRIGGELARDEMITLLNASNPESRIMAARTLGLMKDNEAALPALLHAIKSAENKAIAGELMMALEGFDVSDNYVELFRLYLFGSFKVSMLAKELLDFKEFDITPRVLKKIEKHWNHYQNNVKHDESFEIRRAEVEEMIEDIRNFLKS